MHTLHLKKRTDNAHQEKTQGQDNVLAPVKDDQKEQDPLEDTSKGVDDAANKNQQSPQNDFLGSGLNRKGPDKATSRSPLSM